MGTPRERRERADNYRRKSSYQKRLAAAVQAIGTLRHDEPLPKRDKFVCDYTRMEGLAAATQALQALQPQLRRAYILANLPRRS